MTAPVLRAEALTRRHGDLEAVSGATLEVARGEWVSLVGPSGCGKTSLLLMLGLLDRPTAGRVFLDGLDACTQRNEQRARLRAERIGFVFQLGNLLDRLTARENVALPAWRATGVRRQAEERADELLGRLGLSDRSHVRAGLLSAGEAQRVAVARALVNRPAVVLADEPTGSLDSAAAERVVTALEEVCASGAALLLATHDAHLAARAQRTLSMLDGRLVAGGR